MLDESLPTFRLKASQDKPKINSTFLFSQHGSDFEPSYSVRHLDPDSHASRNRYAVGLYDSYVPDVLFAEVLLIPEWNQLTLSAEQIRLNGGVPPPPEPILPTEFTIQLYNPDQQILVRYKPATFTSAPSWEFEMPQVTFREPSSSALDRSQHDPVASDLTPKIRFKWKKDGKFNKDLVCYQSGKSFNPDGSKKKFKEPDITVALFKNLREVTLYESNFNRVEIEDIKGFEVVLLLGALVIRDVYFAPMKETFNLNNTRRKSSASSPQPMQASISSYTGQGGQSSLVQPSGLTSGRDPRIPPTDPRTQWELDMETASLKRQAAEEERERLRQEQIEQKKVKKMLEAEDKARQRRQAEVDKETERLRKLYGKEDSSARPQLPFRPAAPPGQWPQQPGFAAGQHPQTMHPTPWPSSPNSIPYASGAISQPSLLGPVTSEQPKLKQKSSIFGFRRNSHQDAGKLSKKRSAVF